MDLVYQSATGVASQLTTVIAVDREHLAELQCVWPTWRRWHPEICASVIAYSDLDDAGQESLAELLRPDLRDVFQFFRPSPLKHGNQRDKMLGGLLTEIPKSIETTHWLKIDTDASAVGPGPPLTNYVDGVDSIAAVPWSYSKPADSLSRLDAWYESATGDRVPRSYRTITGLETPESRAEKNGLIREGHVVLTPEWNRRAAERAWWPRVIGWITIINTAFSRRVAEFLIKYPPPFISHDTLLWYLADRWKTPAKTIKFGKLGWSHDLGLPSIKRRAAQTMQATATPVLSPPPPQPRTFDPVLPFASKQPPPVEEPPPLVVTIPSNGTAPPFPWKIKSNPAPVLYELLTSHFGDRAIIGAEIGVHQAATSHYLLQHLPKLFLYMVDPWKEYADKSVLEGDKVSGASQTLMDDAYKLALERTEPYADRRHVIRDTSVGAAKTLMAGLLDFVFIDAAHGYESFCEDFRTWWPKVRSGGLLTGHDLGHRRFKGVRRGLDEMCSAMGLKYDVCPNTVWRLVKP